jgi:hypothetical protein
MTNKKEEEPQGESGKDQETAGEHDTAANEQEKIQLLDEPIPIKDIVHMTILSLESKAWAYLDLVVHPETQKHQKDLKEAKVAIDAIDALYKVLESYLDPEEKKDIQMRLTNLRLNFAKE